jgi:hypothetical protein
VQLLVQATVQPPVQDTVQPPVRAITMVSPIRKDWATLERSEVTDISPFVVKATAAAGELNVECSDSLKPTPLPNAAPRHPRQTAIDSRRVFIPPDCTVAVEKQRIFMAAAEPRPEEPPNFPRRASFL